MSWKVLLHSGSPSSECMKTGDGVRAVEGTGQVCLWEAWPCSLRLGLPVNHSGQDLACEIENVLFLNRVGSCVVFSLGSEWHVTVVNLLNCWFPHSLALISFFWIKLIPLGQGKWYFSAIYWVERFCLNRTASWSKRSINEEDSHIPGHF